MFCVYFANYNIKMDMDMTANNQKSKQNKIIKIQLTHKNDLKILWNFNGLLMPKIFRRHVFISLSNLSTQFKKAMTVMENCYKSFKFGDLYTFGSSNKKNLSWFQKTKISQFYIPEILLSEEDNQECYFSQHMEELRKYREPCFVVLFCGPEHNSQQIQVLIIQFRQHYGLTCLFFIVSPFIQHTKLDFSIGVFRIRQNQSIAQDLQQIYKYYNDHLACLWAQIQIQSKNLDIFVQQKSLSIQSFRSLRQKIYYPLATNITDIIEPKQISQKHKQWQFTLKLKYKLLSGQIYYSAKQIKMPLLKNVEKYVTYNFNKNKQEKQYLIGDEIVVQGNPFLRVTQMKFGI